VLVCEKEEERKIQPPLNVDKIKICKVIPTNLRTGERPGADDFVKERLREDLLRVEMEQCTFMPELNQEYDRTALVQAEVKMTAAAILREDNLVKRKQEKEHEILKNYETELRDASEFNRWQQDMKERDKIEEEMRIAQKKVEMQMAREEAMKSSAAQARRNNLVAQNERALMNEALERKAKEHGHDLQQKQLLVSELMNERYRGVDAMEKVKEDNERVGEEVRADLKKQFDQKKADEEHEMERRVDLIKQIRALDKMKNVVKVDTFDPCEPPRHGMMEEMSLAELRERLQMMNEAHNRMLEKLHDGILSKKDEKKGEIEAKHENIKKIRNIAAVEAAQRRDKLRNKKEDEERQKEELRRQRFDEVTAKLDAKQKAREAEEKRLKKELKLISLKRLFDDLKTGG